MNQQNEIKKNNSKYNTNSLVIIITVILSGLIVGVSIFLWQSIANKRIQEKLQSEITNLEKQLSQYAADNIILQKQINNRKEQLAPDTTKGDTVLATQSGNEIELGSKFLSSMLLTKKNHDAQIKNLDKDYNFQEMVSYNRDLPSGSIAQAYYFNDEPTIFIAGIGENGYMTVNLLGEDTTENKIFLKNKNFLIDNFIKFPDEDKIIYAKGPGNQEKYKVLIISDFNGNEMDYIMSDELPNSIESSRVIGWSKDKQFVYVAKIGWEGYGYAGLWKVNIKTKDVERIFNVDKITLGALSVVPYLDLAVGIESQETACNDPDCFGNITAGVPSKLNKFNLKTNTYKTLITTNESVLDNPLLSPAGNKIFYTERNSGNVYSINTDGEDKKLIGKNFYIKGMSYDGGQIITKSMTANIYKILDLEKSSEKIIPLSGLDNETSIKFLSCNYPLGYSCLYNR